VFFYYIQYNCVVCFEGLLFSQFSGCLCGGGGAKGVPFPSRQPDDFRGCVYWIASGINVGEIVILKEGWNRMLVCPLSALYAIEFVCARWFEEKALQISRF
jgi:hypothetical protein